MYIPHVEDDILNRRELARRRRLRTLALFLVSGGIIAVLVYGGDIGGSGGKVRGETGHMLVLEAPTIRVPPFLDEYAADTSNLAPGADTRWFEDEIKADVLLYDNLYAHGVRRPTIRPVINAIGEHFNWGRSRVGDRYEVQVDREGTILTFRYHVSVETIFEARIVGPGEYDAHRVEVPVDVEVYSLVGIVETNVFGAVVAAGETEDLARKLVDVLKWDIDFSRHVNAGDAFRVIYEKLSLDGNFVRYGELLAVEYRGRARNGEAFYFDEPGSEGYYTGDGSSVQRRFLRRPCRYDRMSSPFDMNRLHPILNVVRPHLGVDFAGPTGNPVRAVADGVVQFAGRRGAAGNLVTIDHADGYRTASAHLDTIASGMRRGVEVRQGQVIGTLGTTGRSTGPHLHFGMKINGEYVDPLVHLDDRMPGLSGRSLREFERLVAQRRLDLAELILPGELGVDDGEALGEEEEGDDIAERGDPSEVADEYVSHEF